MPKHNPIYTERFDQVLLQLVGTVGETKWAEITRQMKNIYEINIPSKPMVQARWRAIDPKINRQPFGADDLVKHWHLCVKHKCHWDAVRAEYEQMGQIRDKSYLSQKFYAHFQCKLVDLNKGLGRIPQYNHAKIELLRDTTKKRILELHDRDVNSMQDFAAKEIVLSCRTLIKVLTYAVDNYKLDFKSMIDEIKKIITADKFQKVLQNLFMVDTIVLISCNEIRPVDEDPELQELEESKRSRYKKPTKVRSWEDALPEPSSPEHSEEEDVLTAGMKINKMMPSSHLTKADIDEIKQSYLYSICNTDQNQVFYDWYNEAKIEKTNGKMDLVIDYEDLKREQELLNGNANKEKKKMLEKTVRKQMKMIEKKKDQIMKNSLKNEEEKIKTVRGKIKLDKELFPGCYTKFFNKESEDESGDQLNVIDVEQIYNINMMNMMNTRNQRRTSKAEPEQV